MKLFNKITLSIFILLSILSFSAYSVTVHSISTAPKLTKPSSSSYSNTLPAFNGTYWCAGFSNTEGNYVSLAQIPSE